MTTSLALTRGNSQFPIAGTTHKLNPDNLRTVYLSESNQQPFRSVSLTEDLDFGDMVCRQENVRRCATSACTKRYTTKGKDRLFSWQSDIGGYIREKITNEHPKDTNMDVAMRRRPDKLRRGSELHTKGLEYILKSTPVPFAALFERASEHFYSQFSLSIVASMKVFEFASGCAFGAALLASGVYLPEVIHAQMNFSNNHMLMVFLGASATSAYVPPTLS